MKSDFFFSKSTGLYVSRKPLKIDSRVKRAAENSKLGLTWDDEGRIHFIDFNESKELLSSLGSLMLGPIEYWKVIEDAKKQNDLDMVFELTSSKYCEWLDRVYLIDDTWIDHPILDKNYNYSGKKIKQTEPVAKPGWFNPENNIDFEKGIPKRVELFRPKFSVSWKYWSPDFSVTKGIPRAIIRGYVTSVGKPSFDQGIPVDAKQPMQMVRECRIKPLEPPIKEDILEQAAQVTKQYNSNKKDLNRIFSFLDSFGDLFSGSKQLLVYKIREKLFDLIGELKIESLKQNKLNEISKLDKLSEKIVGFRIGNVKYDDFLCFVKTSRQRLEEAIKESKDIVFVMGHKNPDSDTVISSLFEAWRNSLLDKEEISYIPIVQNYKIPDEVNRLLGDEISQSILLDEEETYIRAKKSGLCRYISVDQNREPEVQRFFISIIDHHIPSEISKLQDLPKTMEIIGSCTALIVQKMLGAGIYPDKNLGKILHGATLMDTENRVFHKMTNKDTSIMNYLSSLSGMNNEDEFYSDLMSYLLNTDEADILFGRDYKEDWGFGFAVAKVKNCFLEDGSEVKNNLIKRAVKLAEDNNVNKNLPLTILRITDYLEDNITVNRERVYLIFNKESSQEFKESIFDLLEKIVKFEFPDVNIKKTSEFIEFWGTGMQLSRKKTAPILEPVVKVFNEYFYSPSNNLWIKRDFLKESNDVLNAKKELDLNFSFDEEKRINYITYPETRLLTSKLNFSILSLKEYWLALNDAKKVKDIQMIDSLQGSNFVEFLDSVFLNYKIMIEHPEILNQKDRFSFKGKEINITIPKGKPGLIDPDKIDLNTGIPSEVKPPSEYGNPNLWRYWEPDLDLVIPTRSYIFLLKQPCWDGKFHINDSFPNLGIRPCTEKRIFPDVEVKLDEKDLKIIIKKEGDVINYFWEK